MTILDCFSVFNKQRLATSEQIATIEEMNHYIGDDIHPSLMTYDNANAWISRNKDVYEVLLDCEEGEFLESLL